MKNLEKFNAETTPLGTELITRDGREVSEWYYFKTAINSKHPVTAVVGGSKYTFSKDGKTCVTGINNQDLYIKPKVKEIWKNIYRCENNGFFVGQITYLTKEDAKRSANPDYIKTIRITDEPE